MELEHNCRQKPTNRYMGEVMAEVYSFKTKTRVKSIAPSYRHRYEEAAHVIAKTSEDLLKLANAFDNIGFTDSSSLLKEAIVKMAQSAMSLIIELKSLEG